MEYLQLLKVIYEDRTKFSLVAKVAKLQVELCQAMASDEQFNDQSATFYLLKFQDKGMSEECLHHYRDLVIEGQNQFIVRSHKKFSLDKIKANLKLCFGYANLFIE